MNGLDDPRPPAMLRRVDLAVEEELDADEDFTAGRYETYESGEEFIAAFTARIGQSR